MAVESRAILYAFWASSCSWRVRAALYMKGIPFEEKRVDILKEKSQLTEQYRAINPSQKVPALIIDGVTLVESMAIIQYLEDTRPEPSLMPKNALLRAQVREICETVVSGIQPLQNLGLSPRFDTKEQFQKFAKFFINRGLLTLEELLARSAGKYCVGDQLSLADICLVPQIYNAVSRYDLPVSFKGEESKPLDVEKVPTQTWRQIVAEKHPTVSKVYDTLLKEDLFIQTHPKNIKNKITSYSPLQ